MGATVCLCAAGCDHCEPRDAAPRRMAVVYIAGPFSGADSLEVAGNIHRAELLAREVIRLGAAPLTPHSIGANFQGVGGYNYWLAATLEMMRRCDAVLFTDDWQRSPGARGERQEALRRGLPVFDSARDLGTWLAKRAA